MTPLQVVTSCSLVSPSSSVRSCVIPYTRYAKRLLSSFVVFLTIFMFLGAEFFYRLVNNKPARYVPSNADTETGNESKSDSSLALKVNSWATLSRKIKWFIYGATVSCICLFIRYAFLLSLIRWELLLTLLQCDLPAG